MHEKKKPQWAIRPPANNQFHLPLFQFWSAKPREFSPCTASPLLCSPQWTFPTSAHQSLQEVSTQVTFVWITPSGVKWTVLPLNRSVPFYLSSWAQFQNHSLSPSYGRHGGRNQGCRDSKEPVSTLGGTGVQHESRLPGLWKHRGSETEIPTLETHRVPRAESDQTGAPHSLSGCTCEACRLGSLCFSGFEMRNREEQAEGCYGGARKVLLRRGLRRRG